MLPILLYLMWRLVRIAADPRQSVRVVARSRPWHVWLLWGVGLVFVLSFWEFDPGALLYLADPELLAGTMLMMAYQARVSLRSTGRLLAAGWHRTVRRLDHARMCAAVGLQLYGAQAQGRLSRLS